MDIEQSAVLLKEEKADEDFYFTKLIKDFFLGGGLNSACEIYLQNTLMEK